MIQNYLKIAIRNILKHKFYSFINIAGLAIGLSCCLLITLYVLDELIYDKYHEKSDRIYRMGFSGRLGADEFTGAYSAAPVAKAMVNDYPEVEDAVRFRDTGSFLISNGTEKFKEESVLYADSNLFKVFDFHLLQGNPETALKEPNSMVLTPELAKVYFGQEDPMGKMLTLDNQDEFIITGILEPIPANSHFTAKIFLSLESREDSRSEEWLSNNFHTYVVLRKGSDPDLLEEKFPEMARKYIGPQIEQYLGKSFDEFLESGNRIGFFIDPMTSIHLYSTVSGELGNPSDIQYVYIFSAIAAFILIIACINFMNLSTARSANRAREVGVRKVLGSHRNQLTGQFISESILLCLIAIVIAILLAMLALPYFNSIANKSLSLNLFIRPAFVVLTLAGAVIIGLLAGSYPAFYLSSFMPVQVLKSKLTKGAKSGGIRSMLVVFQFVTSTILIVGTLVIYNQLNYVQNKKLGFDKEQVLLVDDAYALGDQLQSFKNEMLKYPEVQSVTISGFLPVDSWRSNNGHFPGYTPTSDNVKVIQSWRVDFDYLATMGIELKEGRNFSPEFPSDSSAVIINETLAAQLGWDNPLGEVISQFTENPEVYDHYTVIGVVNDFHYESMREGIEPLLMVLGDAPGYVALRVTTDNWEDIINKTETQWDVISNGQPFEYSFLDSKFNEMYQTEQRIGEITLIFSGLAIFVACLGLFGLAAFTAEQRSKEIGIRKVMGATVNNIIYLLSKEFGKLILISFVISIPLSWYFMNELFLADFTYRVNLSPLVFVIAGITVFVIAWVTMSYQSMKAALANPVDSLKDE